MCLCRSWLLFGLLGGEMSRTVKVVQGTGQTWDELGFYMSIGMGWSELFMYQCFFTVYRKCMPMCHLACSVKININEFM